MYQDKEISAEELRRAISKRKDKSSTSTPLTSSGSPPLLSLQLHEKHRSSGNEEGPVRLENTFDDEEMADIFHRYSSGLISTADLREKLGHCQRRAMKHVIKEAHLINGKIADVSSTSSDDECPDREQFKSQHSVITMMNNRAAKAVKGQEDTGCARDYPPRMGIREYKVATPEEPTIATGRVESEPCACKQS